MQLKDIVYIAFFVILIAFLGALPRIDLPIFGVSNGVQPIGAMLAGAMLGAKKGGICASIFLILVALGMPLLSGGYGGIDIFVGSMGGFLLGFFPATIVVGALVQCPGGGKSFGEMLASCVIASMLIVYSIGVPWMVVVGNITWPDAIERTLTFVPGDFLNALAAASIAVLLHRIYPKAVRSTA